MSNQDFQYYFTLLFQMVIESYYVILSWQVQSHIFRDIIGYYQALLSYFFMVVWLSWLHHHMLTVSYISRESWVLCLLLLFSVMMCANNRVHHGPMVVFVCLRITLPHSHHYAYLSEDIELLTCFSDAFCTECVTKIKSIISITFM